MSLLIPGVRLKEKKTRKLTCDLTLATVWLLIVVWSGWFRPLRVHGWLPSHHAGSLAATSHTSLSAGFCSMCFSLNCYRFLPKKKKKNQGTFFWVCILFFFHFSLPYFFKYREKQIISIKSLSLTILSNLSSVQCSSCSFKFLPASVRI